jgi:hypothetical protein
MKRGISGGSRNVPAAHMNSILQKNSDTSVSTENSDSFARPIMQRSATMRAGSKQKNVEVEVKKDTMPWGAPTWFLLHTIAEKISDVNFGEIRVSLLSTITAICTNLPCPICADHAKGYLLKIGFSRIRTKEELKEALFVFHNNVNVYKGYPEFLRAELDAKYATANFKAILKNFIQKFGQSFSGGGKYLATEMFRTRLTVRLHDWFNKHLDVFED